ncbi:hypothetical protein SDC9_171169 [bioreactor metagenome]|uniref:Uncharacterized protein n=1 Tax=bioreactor metagenome TaxID=1076179 RepID=A0A645GCC0_9ZZZZ
MYVQTSEIRASKADERFSGNLIIGAYGFSGIVSYIFYSYTVDFTVFLSLGQQGYYRTRSVAV